MFSSHGLVNSIRSGNFCNFKSNNKFCCNCEIARRGGMTTLESRSDKIAQSEAKFSL